MSDSFRCTEEIFGTPLPTKTRRTYFGKSDSTFDIQAHMIFAGKGGTKINKLVHSIEGIVVDRNLASVTPQVDNIGLFLPSLTVRPISADLCSIALRLIPPMNDVDVVSICK